MRHFDQELEQLKSKLLEMSAMVESSIQRSITAVTQKDRKLAEEVFQNEARINEIEIEIDEFAINLLALQQPMAADLRLIVAGAQDQHRSGAHGRSGRQHRRARDVADGRTHDQPMIDIPHIGGLVQSMVRKALDAFVHRDAELARSVLASDDAVDSLRTACYHELTSFMEKDPNHIPQGLNLMVVIRNLERIADHSTNIAEDVLFLVKGIDVRHHAEGIPNRSGQPRL